MSRSSRVCQYYLDIEIDPAAEFSCVPALDGLWALVAIARQFNWDELERGWMGLGEWILSFSFVPSPTVGHFVTRFPNVRPPDPSDNQGSCKQDAREIGTC